MMTRVADHLSRRRSPPLSAAGWQTSMRRPDGFSLVELLVAVSIMLVLIALLGAALSSARASQKRQATQALIAKLDAIIQQQFASYATRTVPSGEIPDPPPSGMTAASHRSWFIRRNMITADLPDRWLDVEYMAANASQFTSPHQRAYIAVWNSMTTKPSPIHAGAECLFMIIMRGGIADCLDCSDLAATAIGDKDEDGAFEFHDAWGNPIEFLLWPAAVELPAGEGTRFFSGTRALQAAFPTTGPASSPSLGMKPLIYSGGPDGSPGFETQAGQSNLGAGTSPPGRNCGNWELPPASLNGGLASGPDRRADNITNLDEEAKR